MPRVGTAVLLGGLALGALGCGGGSGGGAGSGGAAGTSAAGSGGNAGSTGESCPNDFTPCGGDLVGTWHTDLRCTASQVVQAGSGCQGQTFDASKVLSQGTWTFRADLTATFTLSVAGTLTVTAPDACVVSTAGAPIACTDAGAGYPLPVVFVGGEAGATTCLEASGTCTCTVPYVAAPISGDGTYSKSGNTVTVSIGSQGTPVDYCVSGTTLKMRGSAGNGAAKVSVYQKQ